MDELKDTALPNPGCSGPDCSAPGTRSPKGTDSGRYSDRGMDPKELEVMAPAGSFECLQAAIQGGADSVYFGVGRLNMRSRSAGNFAPEDLGEVMRICREAGVKAYLTLNITIYGEDLAAVRETLLTARDAGVDAVIAFDVAVIQLCRELGLEVHISTQMSVSNIESLRFWARYADVIVLARELTLVQVRSIYDAVLREHITGPSGNLVRIEMFVHGALCMAVSGKCFLSLHNCGASANRGACLQICRRGYRVTDLETGTGMDIENKYIMSPKDLCTIEFLHKIVDSGVRVFKIEGRARSAEYVRTTVECYRRAADAVAAGEYGPELASELKASLAGVFNRGFWDGWYQGALIGEWSSVYGSQATHRRTYLGKVTNWFDRLGVAEIAVEACELHKGDTLLATGATTGAVQIVAEDIRVEYEQVEMVPKGVRCSLAVDTAAFPDGRMRRGDKIFLWK